MMGPKFFGEIASPTSPALKNRKSYPVGAEVDRMEIDEYHQLDSDAEEDYAHYQSIETSIHAEGTSKNNSSSYQSLDDRPRQNSQADSKLPLVRIEVSSMTRLPKQAQPTSESSDLFPSPRPSQIAREGSDSGNASLGGATRSSTTTNTSGHTTHATSITSGHHSGVSFLSETDREVMETIKQGKRRRRLQILPSRKNTDADGTSIHSLSTTSTTTNGYIALAGSPVCLREGANVPAERFFTNSEILPSGSPGGSGNTVSFWGSVISAAGNVQIRAQSSVLRRGVGSNDTTPATSSTASTLKDTSSRSMRDTSSRSSTSTGPPTFVSYPEPQVISTGREATEIFRLPRGGDLEEREDSPAEIVGYPEVIFEEAKTPITGLFHHQPQPKPVRPARDRLRGRLERFRSSRPPLSPIKGSRTPTTPPPMGSPSYHQLSPPRNIVDHRLDSNVPRPYVVRTNPNGQSGGFVDSQQHFINDRPMGLAVENRNNQYYHHHHNYPPFNNCADGQGLFNINHNGTYEERNIEILKTDSKDEMANPRFISPEKNTDSH